MPLRRSTRCAVGAALAGRGELLPAAGDWAAPFRARLEEARASSRRARRPAAARRSGGRRARGRRRRRPVPGAAVGAADRRALPSRPPGRRARRLPARPRPLADDLGLEPGPATAGARAPGPRPVARPRRPATCRRWRPRSSAATRTSRRRASCSSSTGSSRSSGPAASARPRWRSRPAARCAGASGSSGSRRRTTADEVLDAVIAALDVTGGEAALLERLRLARRGADPRQLRARRSRPRRRSPSGCSTRHPGCGSSHEPGPARARRRAVLRAGSARARPRRRAVHPPRRAAGHRARTSTELCRSLDGLPLAIELAAARTRRSRSTRSPAASTTASPC